MGNTFWALLGFNLIEIVIFALSDASSLFIR